MKNTNKKTKNKINNNNKNNNKVVMTSKSLKLSFCGLLSLIIVLIAYWYEWRIEDNLRMRIELTHESLLNIEESVSVNPKTKIAIGFGSCLDIIAKSRDIILDRFLPPLKPKHFDLIETSEELVQVFGYFYQFGAAAEYVLCLQFFEFFYIFSIFSSCLAINNFDICLTFIKTH